MDQRSTLAIETSKLVKAFGDTRAIDGIDLAVPAGMVYGVLGPNGAGKTTMIRVLATLLNPTGGTACVFGRDVVEEADAVRREISVTGQYASVDEGLTGTENLILMARLRGYTWSQARQRAEELLDAFGLSHAGTRLLSTYSGGMRRRLDIAASIVVTPSLLFLDEPTTGLDPRSRSQVWEIVRALVDLGTTVLLTTQYLEETDRLANRIAVIDHGTVIAEGTAGELKSSIGVGVLHVRLRESAERERARQVVAESLGVHVYFDPDPAELTAQIGDSERANRALGSLARSGIDVDQFAFGQPSLDEVFLTLTGHKADVYHATEENAA